MPDLTRGAHSACYEEHYADKNQVKVMKILRGCVMNQTLVSKKYVFFFFNVNSLFRHFQLNLSDHFYEQPMAVFNPRPFPNDNLENSPFLPSSNSSGN